MSQGKHDSSKIKAKSNTKLFFSGVLFLTIANLIVKVIGLLFKMPMSNNFGDTVMGYYNAAYKIYTWFYMISTAGLPVAVSILVSEAKTQGRLDQIKRIFRATVVMFFIIGLAGSSMMFFGAGWFSRDVIQNEPARYSIMVIAPMLFFICLSSAMRGYFQGFQQMIPTAVSELIEAFCKLGVGIAFALYAKEKYGADQYHIIAAYAAVGLTVGAALSMVYLVFAKLLFKEKRYTAEFLEKCGGEDHSVDPFGKTLRRILVIALPIALSASIMPLADLLDSVIVQRLLQRGGMFFAALGQEEMTHIYGIYTTKAVSMFNLPPVLIYPISASIIPLISAARAQRDKARVQTIMSSSFRVAVLLGAPCALGLVALAEPVLSVFYTNKEDVAAAAPLLRLLAPATFFVCLLAVMTAILQSAKRERLPLVSIAIGVVVKIASSYLLIGLFGMIGTPISTLVCYITICSIHMHFCRKYAGLRVNFLRDLARPILCGAVCALTAYGAEKLFSIIHPGRFATLGAIVVAAVVYAVVIFLLRAITLDDVLLLPKGAKIARALQKIKLLKA